MRRMRRLKFDLTKAVEGHPVVTRNGVPATEPMLFHGVTTPYPLYMVVGGKIESFTVNGKFNTDVESSDLDLFMEIETITRKVMVLQDKNGVLGSVICDPQDTCPQAICSFEFQVEFGPSDEDYDDE